MTRKLIAFSLCLCLAAAVFAAAAADPIEALIAKGLKAYKEGNSQDSIAALQEAILLMQKSKEKDLLACLPKAPAGWEAGKVDSGSTAVGTGEGGMTCTQLSQTFTRKADDARATVTITNSEQLMQAHKAMADAYKNPELVKMMNQDPNTKFKMITQDGWTGWSIIHKDQNAEAVTFSGGYMVNIQISKADEKALDAFWNGTDFKAIGKLKAAEPASKPSGKSK